MTKQDRARKALQRQLDRMYNKLEQDHLEFNIDKEDEHSYSWRFKNKGSFFELVYGYVSKTVTICSRG